MKSFIRSVRLSLALVAALFITSLVCAGGQDQTYKLHTGANKIMNVVPISGFAGGLNDSNTATKGVSNTVDLSGADIQKASFVVVWSSAAGTGAGTLNVQVSPDGGTNWVSTGDTISLSTGTGGAGTAYASDKALGGGTKMRLTSTLTNSTTFYSFKVWNVSRAD